jgi:hypothetical protein
MLLPPMSANPHLYDYKHSLRFRDDLSVDLIDGAGQVFNAVARGSYHADEIAPGAIEVSFHGLVRLNPYGPRKTAPPMAPGRSRDLKDSDPLASYAEMGEIPAFSVRCIVEGGMFPFPRQVMWNVGEEDEQPCLLYYERFVFDRDPLWFARPNQERNLYYLWERVELIDSARYYYPEASGIAMTWAQLVAMGVTKDDLLHDVGRRG